MGCIKCGSSVQNKDMYCNDCRPDFFKEASGERNTDENGMFNVDKFRQGSPIKYSNQSENLSIRRNVVNTRTTTDDIILAAITGIIAAVITTSYYSVYENVGVLPVVVSVAAYGLLVIVSIIGNMKSKALVAMSIVYWLITSVKFIMMLGLDAYI